MEGKFTDFVIDELETLLGDLKAALQPSNIVLHEKVMQELRKQYERDRPRRSDYDAVGF